MVTSGADLRRLTEAGGPLDARSVESAYAHPPGELRANFVVTLDGAVEIAGQSGRLGGAADRELFATLRALADVILVGAGTARAENYGPAWLTPERRERRAERGQPPLPTIAVASRRGDLDAGARLFAERRDTQPEPPRPLVLTCGAAPEAKRRLLAEVADVRVFGDDAVDLPSALASLHPAGAPARVLCEGGPGLFGDLVAAGLVDELCLTVSPLLAGVGRVTLTGSWAPSAEPEWLALAGLFAADGHLFARYRRSSE